MIDEILFYRLLIQITNIIIIIVLIIIIKKKTYKIAKLFYKQT